MYNKFFNKYKYFWTVLKAHDGKMPYKHIYFRMFSLTALEFLLLSTKQLEWTGNLENMVTLSTAWDKVETETILNALENVFFFLMWFLLIYELISWVLV